VDSADASQRFANHDINERRTAMKTKTNVKAGTGTNSTTKGG
jgi:hypothetical protein